MAILQPPRRTGRDFFAVALVAAGFLSDIALAQELPAGAPHVVYGGVTTSGGAAPTSDNLSLAGFVLGAPMELEHASSTGWGYAVESEVGSYWAEVSAFGTGWAIGEQLRLMAVDAGSDESGYAEVTLDGTGAQQVAINLEAGDNIGPLTHSVLAEGDSPYEVPQGTSTVAIAATSDDTHAGGSPLAAAEVFADSDPGTGSGTSADASDGTFDGLVESVSVEVDSSSWIEGEAHTVYVRARDSAGNWGTLGEVEINVGAPDGALRGDVDGDGDVDRDDLTILMGHRNQPASGPNDPKDLDGDGSITALDTRILVTLCTRTRCGTE